MTKLMPARTYNQNHVARKYTGQATPEHLLDVELPMGIPARPRGNGKSLLHHDRGPQRIVAGTTKRRSGPQRNSCRESPVRWSFFTALHLASSKLPAKPPAIRSLCSSASIRRATSCPLTSGFLADTDTLLVFGLDHILSEQEASPEEIASIREWLKREGTCLLLAPHHDVGFTNDLAQRQVEYLHHGDRLVPRQQRFGQYTRSLMKALDVPVHNTYGLRPAVVKGTDEIAPLSAFRDIDELGLLNNVPTLNFHPHLPHYELTREDKSVHVLARQPIDLDRPHPFTATGNTEFNCLLWMSPNQQRAGHVVLLDSTHFTTLFGGTESLRNLWHNFAVMQ